MEQQRTPHHAARLSLEGNSGKCREEIKGSLEINQHFFGKGQMTKKHVATLDDSKSSVMKQMSVRPKKYGNFVECFSVVCQLQGTNMYSKKLKLCQSCTC